MVVSISYYKDVDDILNILKEDFKWTDKDSVIISFIINEFNIGTELKFYDFENISTSKSLNFTNYILNKLDYICEFYNKSRIQIIYALLLNYKESKNSNKDTIDKYEILSIVKESYSELCIRIVRNKAEKEKLNGELES